jgi:tRNA modification GTPase
MSATRLQCLTPSGSGAIAVIAVVGPDAWNVTRRLFRPASSKPLPDLPMELSTWFGTMGTGPGDEVIVSIPTTLPELVVEVHCHGGTQVVRWLIDLLRSEGCVEAAATKAAREQPWELLPNAKTLRTAAIFLDQANGAFDRELEAIRRSLLRGESAAAEARLRELMRFAPVGRHLIEPWHVAIAGAPNAGKSSLLNALAGCQRSIVASVPGTTRDVVTATLAFDGWPVALSDTAGLRSGGDELEQEGIERAKQQIRQADLCLWVIDSTVAPPPALTERPLAEHVLPVLNKTDLPSVWDRSCIPEAVSISCVTGAGLNELIGRMVAALVPAAPLPDTAVPYSAETRELVGKLLELLAEGRLQDAINGIDRFLSPYAAI